MSTSSALGPGSYSSSASSSSSSACPSASAPADPKRIDLDQCIARIKQVIKQIKLPHLNEQLSKLSCPITAEFPIDPVVTHCGHLFERSAIQDWKNRNKPCPECRGPIGQFTPVYELKKFVEDRLPEPVLTLSKFKGQNQKRATQYIEIAKSCIDEMDHQGALEALAQGLQYTNSSAVYAQVPVIYDQMKSPENACLSRLYLSLYQLQEGKVQEAAETLNMCKADVLDKDSSIVELVLQLSPSSETLDWAMKSALGLKTAEDSLPIYKQIIALDPYRFDAYEQLSALTKDPEEKRRVLLQAAHFAHTAGKADLETAFRKEAEIPLPTTVISKKGWSDPKSIDLPPYPQALKDFLNANCPIWPGKKRYETHIVVPLFPDVSLNEDKPPVPLTLESLDQLDTSCYGTSKFRYIWDHIPKNIPALREFRYAVMTNDVIPGSRGQTFAAQAAMLPAGYKMPGVFDATRAILWENRRAGKQYFGNNPPTYTRCGDDEIFGYRLIVGGFILTGFRVDNSTGITQQIGVAGWREF